MRRARVLAVLGTVLLFLLHNNWWSWNADPVLLFGFLPLELLYRLGWVLLAAVVLWLAVRGWWPHSDG